MLLDSPARRLAALATVAVVEEVEIDVAPELVVPAAVSPADMARLFRICWWLDSTGLGRICRWIWAAFGFSLATSEDFMLARDCRIVFVDVINEDDVDNGTMVTELLLWLN